MSTCDPFLMFPFSIDFVATTALRGAVALLDKYVEILQAHVMQILSLSCDIVSTSSCHFLHIVSVVEQGVSGVCVIM